MRILAIRGEKLASLAAPFELCFDGPPLASSRIFAIVGATGAGKSTILDALCLALFHRTPRLGDMAGGSEVSDQGGERIKSYDPRALLHRGATSAFAECEFEGSDGGLYRARWSVRRARTGRLQAAKSELFHLESGVAIGRTKGEVAGEIVRRLGLDFEQFRRSVLLAQGDFAAFLRASATERGELLASMTATTVYAALSRAAHERARDEQVALRERRAAGQRFSPLDDKARAKLDALVLQLSEDVAGLEASVVSRRKRVGVLSRDLKLQESIDAADANVADKRRLARDVVARRQALLHARSADRFRDVIRAVDERRAASAAVGEQLKSAESSQRERGQHLLSLRQQGEAHLEKRRAFDTAGASFEKEQSAAEKLDTLVLRAQEAVRQTQEALRDARGQRDTLAATLAGRRKSIVRLNEEEAEDAAWFHARPYRERGLVDSVVQALAERERATALQRELSARAEGTEAARTYLAASTQDLKAELERARSAWAVADEAMRASSPAAVAAAQKVRATTKDALIARQELRRVAQAHGEAVKLSNAAGVTQRRAAKGLKDTDEKLAAASDIHGRARQALQDADTAFEDASRLQDAARLREHLHDDEECPVCGSLEHPRQPGGGDIENIDALATTREKAAEQVRESERMVADLREQRGAAESRLTLSGEAVLAAAASAASSAEDVMRAEALFIAALAAIEGHTMSPDALVRAAKEKADAPDALDEALAGAEKALTTAIDASERARENAARRDRANGAREHAQRALEKCQEQLRAAAETHADLVRRVADSDGDQERLATQLEALAGLGWAEPGFAESVEEDAASLMTRRGLRDERRSKLGKLSALSEEAAEREAKLSELLVAREAAAAKAQEILALRRGERAPLLGGLSLADARSKRSQQDIELREASDAHGTNLADAERLDAAARAGLEALRETKARIQGTQRTDDAELARRLAEARVDEAFVREHLASALDRDHEEHALRKIDEALSVAGARADQVRAEQRGLRAEHPGIFGAADIEPLQGNLFSAPLPPGETVVDVGALRGDADEALRSAEEDLELRREALIESRATQQMDDEGKKNASSLAGDLEALEAGAKVWDELADLIGSSDGKKFQLFAQGLTLDILLGHANVQLARLFPRYRLERAPGSDLSLQVSDLDMGGVIRSVDTLSGGETFIVSLALALALAGLSAKQTPLRTLFIDEGFGSLDAASLETVLDVLDAVQAQGKQIGIISHVADIAERFRVRVNVQREGDGRSVVSLHPPASDPADMTIEETAAQLPLLHEAR